MPERITLWQALNDPMALQSAGIGAPRVNAPYWSYSTPDGSATATLPPQQQASPQQQAGPRPGFPQAQTGGQKLEGGTLSFEAWAARQENLAAQQKEVDFNNWASAQEQAYAQQNASLPDRVKTFIDDSADKFTSSIAPVSNAVRRGLVMSDEALALENLREDPLAYVNQRAILNQARLDYPQTQQADAIDAATEAGSLGDLFNAWVTNPVGALEKLAENTATFIPNTIEQAKTAVPVGASAGAMLGAGGGPIGATAGAGIGAGGGLMTAAGVGSASVDAAESMNKTAKSVGYDLNNIEQALDFVSRPELVDLAEAEAVINGLPVAVGDFAGAGLGGRLFTSVGKGVLRKLGATLGETGVQATTGMGGELGKQVAASRQAGNLINSEDSIGKRLSTFDPRAFAGELSPNEIASEGIMEFLGAGGSAAKIAAGAAAERIAGETSEKAQAGRYAGKRVQEQVDATEPDRLARNIDEQNAVNQPAPRDFEAEKAKIRQEIDAANARVDAEMAKPADQADNEAFETYQKIAADAQVRLRELEAEQFRTRRPGVSQAVQPGQFSQGRPVDATVDATPSPEIEVQEQGPRKQVEGGKMATLDEVEVQLSENQAATDTQQSQLDKARERLLDLAKAPEQEGIVSDERRAILGIALESQERIAELKKQREQLEARKAELTQQEQPEASSQPESKRADFMGERKLNIVPEDQRQQEAPQAQPEPAESNAAEFPPPRPPRIGVPEPSRRSRAEQRAAFLPTAPAEGAVPLSEATQQADQSRGQQFVAGESGPAQRRGDNRRPIEQVMEAIIGKAVRSRANAVEAINKMPGKEAVERAREMDPSIKGAKAARALLKQEANRQFDSPPKGATDIALDELSMNAFMNPKLWYGLMKKAGRAGKAAAKNRDVLGVDEFLSRMADEKAEAIRAVDGGRPSTNAIKDLLMTVPRSMESNKQTGRKYGKKYPSLEPINDGFYTLPGSDRATGVPFQHAYDKNVAKQMQKVAEIHKIFDDATSGMSRQQRYFSMSRIASSLRGRRVELSAVEKQVAQKMRKVFDDVREYMKSAGVEVGEVDNYLTRNFDIEMILKIIADSDSFENNPFTIQAEKAYRDSRLSQIAAMDDMDAITEAEGLKGEENASLRKRMRDQTISDAERANVARQALRQRTNEWAKQSAIELTKAIEMGTFGMDVGRWQGFVNSFSQPVGQSASITKKRKLGPEADKHLGDFYENDVFKLLSAYVQRGVSIAERTRRLGTKDSRLRDAIIEARKQGMNQKEEADYMMSLASTMGMAPPVHDQFRPVNSLARLVSTSMLTLSAITSLPEAAVIAAQGGGNPAKFLFRAATNLGGSMLEFIKGHNGQSDARRMAEFLGLATDAAIQNVMLHRYASAEFGSGYENRMVQKMVVFTLLPRLTEAQIVTSIKAGELVMNDLVRQYSKGAKQGKGSGFTKDEFAEFGIPQEKVDEYAKWHSQYYSKSIQGRMEMLSKGGEMASLHENALQTFSAISIQQPGAATKNKYASRSNFVNMITHLTQFLYAFHENFIVRSARRMARGWKGTASDGTQLTAMQRLSTMSQAAYFAPIAMLAYANDYFIKQPINDLFHEDDYDEEDEETWKKILKGIDRAGGFGKMSPVLNAFFSVSYNRDPANVLSGPAISKASQVFKAVSQYVTNNKPENNSAERKLARELYDVLIKTSMISLISAAAPLPGKGAATKAARGAAFGSIQGVSNRGVRERAVSTVAGPADQRGPGRSSTNSGFGSSDFGSGGFGGSNFDASF